jgi:DNA polymerase-1
MGERMALNAPVQGSAADIIKRAMIALHAALGSARLETAMVLQVHDELVLESPPGEIEEAGRLIVLVMENVVKLDIPLRVDLATGANLAETKAR